MKAIIILPTYNEKDNIEKIVTTLEEEVFPQIKKWEVGILVADDTSPDGTADIVKRLMKKYKTLHLLIGPKQGLGAAYIRAMDYAIKELGADVVFEMDADGQHEPQKIPHFLQKIDEGYDMVIGSRYSGGGSIPQTWGLKRRIYSTGANLLVKIVLGRWNIHDWTGGYRAIKKEIFLKEHKELTATLGYTFQISFLHKAVRDGFKVAEVPFLFLDRTKGDSKIAPKEYMYNVLKYIFTARFKELERFLKFLIVGGTGFLVQIIAQEGSVALGITHAIAVANGAEGAILSNFFINNFWTFKDTRHLKQTSNFVVRLIKFNIASLASILVQVIAVWLGEKILTPKINLFSHPLPTRIIILFPTIIFIVIPMNYIIYNKLIWKTQHLKQKKT